MSIKINNKKEIVRKLLQDGKRHSSRIFLKNLDIYNRYIGLREEIMEEVKYNKTHRLLYLYVQETYFYNILTEEFKISFNYICSTVQFVSSLTTNEIKEFKRQANQNLI